jgi:acetylornithine/succinyldiaminopimelate/putrescine aminotransferase
VSFTSDADTARSSTRLFHSISVEFQPFTEAPSAASVISGAAAGATKSEALPGSVPQKGRVKDIGSRVAKKCLAKGMLILTTSVFDVIRFIPALNVTEEEMALACKIFKESVEEVANEG